MGAKELISARKDAGLSQEKMSDLLGIPRRTIEDWERSKRKCPDYVERLIIAELNRLSQKAQENS